MDEPLYINNFYKKRLIDVNCYNNSKRYDSTSGCNVNYSCKILIDDDRYNLDRSHN